MKAILIDDEKLALDYLEHQLKSVSDIEIIGKYTNPLQGKKAIEENEVELTFLDIQIPDLNGMELAEQLLEKNPQLQIVFVTAYDEYAIKAFELNALDYVLKPVSTARLLTTIKRIEQTVNNRSPKSTKQTEKLRLTLFKQVTFYDCSDGQRNKIPLKWRTTKTEQLFLYLLQHRGQEVSKILLIDLLWPDFDLEKAYQQLYTSVYHIRKALGEYHHHFTIKSIRDDYLLQVKDIYIDVEQFETLMDSLLPLSRETIADYEKVLTIYKGDYLEKYDYIWIESECQRLHMKWASVALKVVHYYYEQEVLEKALTLSLDIVRQSLLEEEAHFFVMKIYNKFGNFSAVHRHYAKLKEVLLTELQVEPRPDITKWYFNWIEKNKEVPLEN